MQTFNLYLNALVAVAVLLPGVPAAAGNDFSIDWYTVDGGGEMFSAGGEFELSGTLGQWDASQTRELSGGHWKLTGGFWGLTLEELADLLFSDRFDDE